MRLRNLPSPLDHAFYNKQNPRHHPSDINRIRTHRLQWAHSFHLLWLHRPRKCSENVRCMLDLVLSSSLVCSRAWHMTGLYQSTESGHKDILKGEMTLTKPIGTVPSRLKRRDLFL